MFGKVILENASNINIRCFRLLATILSQFSKVKWYKNKNQGRAFACFVDLCKAYDSAMQRLLWGKQTLSGISTQVIKLLKSLYKNIYCRVKVGALLSNLKFFIIILVLDKAVHSLHSYSISLF